MMRKLKKNEQKLTESNISSLRKNSVSGLSSRNFCLAVSAVFLLGGCETTSELLGTASSGNDSYTGTARRVPILNNARPVNSNNVVPMPTNVAPEVRDIAPQVAPVAMPEKAPAPLTPYDQYDNYGNEVAQSDDSNFFTDLFTKLSAPSAEAVEESSDVYSVRKALSGNPPLAVAPKPQPRSMHKAPLLEHTEFNVHTNPVPEASKIPNEAPPSLAKETPPVLDNNELEAVAKIIIPENVPEGSKVVVEIPAKPLLENSVINSYVETTSPEEKKEEIGFVTEPAKETLVDNSLTAAPAPTVASEEKKEESLFIAEPIQQPAIDNNLPAAPAPTVASEEKKEEEKTFDTENKKQPLFQHTEYDVFTKPLIEEQAKPTAEELPAIEAPKDAANQQPATIESNTENEAKNENIPEKAEEQTLLGSIGSKLDIFDATKNSETQAEYPEISSVPAKPAEFEIIKMEKKQEFENLEYDHYVAEQEKQSLDSETAGVPQGYVQPSAVEKENVDSSSSSMVPVTPQLPISSLNEVNVETTSTEPNTETANEDKSAESNNDFAPASGIVGNAGALPSPDIIKTMRPSRYESIRNQKNSSDN